MNQILYAHQTICPGLPHHFDTAHRELLGTMRTFSVLMLELWNRRGHYLIGTDHVLWKWEHYRPELQSQIGVRRGDHFIKVHMTFIASIKLNQDKSVHSRHINHPNLNIDKNHLIPAQQPSLELSRLDKINLDLTHSCNCCVVFSHLELSVINAFVMTRDLDTHKPMTTCTPHAWVS